ncbi:PPPDE domain-containing protein [Entamoeba marina]
MRRTPHGEPVILHVYDLMDNSLLYPMGMGAYHSGVCIYNREYTFSESGVFNTAPKQVDAQFRTAIQIGTFTGGTTAFDSAINELKKKFVPGSYDLYANNCNHFSNALCQKLIGKEIPSWVNRMAGVGAWYNGGKNKTTTDKKTTHPTGNTTFTGKEHKLSDKPTQPLPSDKEQRRLMMLQQYQKK